MKLAVWKVSGLVQMQAKFQNRLETFSTKTSGTAQNPLTRVTGHNGHKPKRPQPKRPQPKRPQTKKATDRNGQKPKQPQAGMATNQNGHKPKWPHQLTPEYTL